MNATKNSVAIVGTNFALVIRGRGGFRGRGREDHKGNIRGEVAALTKKSLYIFIYFYNY